MYLVFVLVDVLVVDELVIVLIDALVLLLVQVLCSHSYVPVEALICVPVKQLFQHVKQP